MSVPPVLPPRLEDEAHADARDRAAVERREQQVVAGEMRDVRRHHVDEHGER